MIEKLKEDFEEFKDRVFGILLYGSYAKDEYTKRSDIDISLVGVDRDTYMEILGKLGNKYDIKIFEELPLYIKIDIIKNHKVIFGDELELSEYFYKF